MNLTELIRRTRRYLAEGSTGQFVDAEISEQLNASARQLAQEYALLTRRVTVTTDVDGHGILPADAVGIVAARNTTNRYDLTLLNPGQYPMPDEATMTGSPQWFTFQPGEGGPLIVYPAGVVDVTLDILSAGYPMSVGTDTPWLNAFPEWHYMIALHAAHHLGAFRGGTGAAQTVYLQRFNQALDEFRGAMAVRALTTTQAQFTPLTRFPSRSLR